MVAIKKKDLNVDNKSRVVFIIVFVLVLILIPIAIWLLGHSIPPAETPKSDFTVYQANGNTFSYPKGWKVSESGVPEGAGEVYYLQPPNADPIVNPHVLLKITPATQKEITTMNLVYTLLKYQKMNIMVSGVSAQKYVDVLPGTHGIFHSIAYVFIAKGNIYLLELGYTQKATDPQLENEFTQIVNNFSTN